MSLLHLALVLGPIFALVFAPDLVRWVARWTSERRVSREGSAATVRRCRRSLTRFELGMRGARARWDEQTCQYIRDRG